MSRIKSKNIKILVIDPDEDFARDVQMFLEDTYCVTTRQIIDLLDYTIILNNIDVIILSVDSVDIAFITLLEKIRRNHSNIKIIIMYTYLSSDRAVEKKLIEFTDDIITKPFDVTILKNKVDSVLIAN